MSGDESLKKFGLLCQQVTAEPSLTIKQELIRGFISRFTGDLGLLLKLLLPKNANRIYYAQEKQLLRVLSIVLNVPEKDLKSEWNRNGCIGETAQKHFKAKVVVDRDGWCNMTLARFDSFLDQMAAASNEVMRVGVVRALFDEACAHAVYLFFRELKLDLRLGAGIRVVLRGLHPSAYEIFQHCADIQEVVRRVKAGGDTQSLPEDSTTGGLDDDVSVAVGAKQVPAPTTTEKKGGASVVRRGAVAAEIKLGMPLAPMLAAPAKTVDQVLSKCPNGAFSEVKYDGERIQVHKQGGKLTFFARSLKPMRPDKYAGLEPYLSGAIQATDCILDGEILMVDINTSIPLPFGTLGKHKRTQFATACPCVFLFDILYKDGESLLQMPLEQRRVELKKAVTFTRNRVMFSELCLVKGDMAQRRAILQQHLNHAIAEGLEGLVIKDVHSVYEPRARHWLKLKKDYLDGLADSADLLVLGAWYGSGNKGGILSTFLMGCVDTTVPAGHPGRYKTVCKVGNGLDDMALTVLSQKYTSRMSRPSQGEAPAWLDCHSSHLPDMVMQDPNAADVMEIIGAEFSVTKTHTGGISIRFPRILRVRTDKNSDSATTLQELMQLFRTSKEKLTSAGVPASLQLADSYVIAPGGAGGEDEEASNMEPVSATTVATHVADSTSHTENDSTTARDTENAAYALAAGLSYVKGDATKPAVPDSESVVLCHCSAIGGAWSHRGFMGRVTQVFGGVAEQAYTQSVGKRTLGNVILTEVGDAHRVGRVFVATVLGQDAAPRGQTPPVNQTALLEGLKRCIAYARRNNASLHIVRPADDSGVDWNAVDETVLRQASTGEEGVKLVVYGAEPARKDEASMAAPTSALETAPALGPSVTKEAVHAAKKRERSPELQQAPPLSHTGAVTVAASSALLPRSWWTLFHDVRAQIIGHPPATLEMQRKVDMLGGRVVHAGEEVQAGIASTHVILLVKPGHGAAATVGAVPLHASVVTGQWVDDCFALGRRHAEELYHPSRLSILAGCRLLLPVSLENRQEWARLASLLGATLHDSWCLVGERSTHCIGDVWNEEAEKVFSLGGRVVTPQWLVDSAVAQVPLPARAYLLPRTCGKSGASAVVNPLEGILCGLKVCVLGGDGVSTGLASAVASAVQQMGGEVTASPMDAQYCIVPREVFEQQQATLSPAVRFRCVGPEWLWESARTKTLQDPSTYSHSRTEGTPTPNPSRTSPAATNDDGEEAHSSASSTISYEENDRELQANGSLDVMGGDSATDLDDNEESKGNAAEHTAPAKRARHS